MRRLFKKWEGVEVLKGALDEDLAVAQVRMCLLKRMSGPCRVGWFGEYSIVSLIR